MSPSQMVQRNLLLADWWDEDHKESLLVSRPTLNAITHSCTLHPFTEADADNVPIGGTRTIGRACW